MNTLDMNMSGEDSKHAGRIILLYNAKLYGNFMSLLGDPAEADDCLRETFRHFFHLMKDLRWEADVETMDRYLMRIAGGVSSARLAEQRRRHAEAVARQEQESMLAKPRREAFRPAEQLAQLKQLFVRTFGVVREPRLRQADALH